MATATDSPTSTVLAELLAEHEVLTVDHRSVRNLDGSIGISIDRGALERLGVVDADGNVDAGHHAKVTILDNGLALVDLQIEH